MCVFPALTCGFSSLARDSFVLCGRVRTKLLVAPTDPFSQLGNSRNFLRIPFFWVFHRRPPRAFFRHAVPCAPPESDTADKEAELAVFLENFSGSGEKHHFHSVFSPLIL
tara:strand:+ start:256 stop:585 length:330 start_codon:yes stop_codon:yes gene_type:complete